MSFWPKVRQLDENDHVYLLKCWLILNNIVLLGHWEFTVEAQSICWISCCHFFPSDVPLVHTLVSAPYSGCMEVSVNGRPVDLDGAIHKHNDIRSHSCPLLDSLQWPELQSASTDPYAVHSGNGDDFQYIYKSFDQWGDVLDWNVNKQNNPGYPGAAWSPSPGSPCPFNCDDTAA